MYMTSAKRAMASLGLKIACAVTMVNALVSLGHGQSASGLCPVRTCGGSGGVEIRFPFILHNDPLGKQCYTEYPDLQFYCMSKVLFLNFTEKVKMPHTAMMLTR